MSKIISVEVPDDLKIKEDEYLVIDFPTKDEKYSIDNLSALHGRCLILRQRYTYPWPEWVKKGTILRKGNLGWYIRFLDSVEINLKVLKEAFELPEPPDSFKYGTLLVKE